MDEERTPEEQQKEAWARQEKADMKMVKDIIKLLREQFDTVQIFCTRYNKDTGETTSVAEGVGDYYSRIGITQIWLAHQLEYQATHGNGGEDE